MVASSSRYWLDGTDARMHQETSNHHWWSGPSGVREVLVVALPLVISSLSWTVMTFIDRIFLRWVSGEAMSAAFSASMVWFLILCLPLGICAYANTFVAQYFGDHQWRRIGSAVWQAIWLAVLCIPMTWLMIEWAPAIFRLADHAPTVQQHEVTYFRSIMWGGGGMLVAQAAAAFYSGRGKTLVVMWVDTAVAIVNIGLDYLWIFGHAGFPAMGVAGAGYATSVALWLKAAIYVGLLLQSRHRREFGTMQGMRWDGTLFWRLLYFGGPSGLQMLLDLVGFTAFVILVNRLGMVEAEATSMAFSVSTLAFMPIWGFGMAAGVLVGQRLGDDQPMLAARATWTTLGVALTYMAVISTCYVCVPQLFLFGFDAGNQAAPNQAQVAALATSLLRYVAAYNLLDAVLTIFVNAIKGAGDTRFVFFVSLVMGTLLAAGSWLAVEILAAEIHTCWLLITGWIWIMAAIFTARFVQGKWRNMRVIE